MDDSEKTKEQLIEELEALRAEKARLRENEELIRSLAENVPSLVFSIDSSGNILSLFNTAVRGVEVDSVVGVSMFAFMEPEYHETVMNCVRDVFEEGKPRSYETRGLGPDGTLSHYFSQMGPVFDSDGNVASAIISALDVTKHKRAEEQLRETAEFTETYLTASPIGIATYRQSGECVSTNESMVKMVGATRAQVLDQNFRKIVSWKASGLLQDACAVLSDGLSRTRQIHAVSTFGKDIWLECRLARFSSSGQPHLLLITDNIIERKRAEDELRQTEERFRLFMDRVPGLAYIKDSEGKVLFANQGFLSYLQLEPEAMLNKTTDEIFAIEFADKIAADDSRVLTSGRSEEIDESFSGRTWSTHKFVIPQLDGTSLLGGLTLDITEREQLEQQLLQSQKMEAVGTLAGGIAHDMNNVLAVVLGLGSVLEKEMGSEDPKVHDIREITSAARRGKSLVENLLGFARKGNYQKMSVSLNDTVRQLVDMLGHSIPKKVAVNTFLDDYLATVECDPAQMVQTLMNLCLNASDALDGSGTITISTNNEALGAGNDVQLAPGRYAKIQVKDNGSGMDEEARKRAFEPFFTTKDIGKGTGLGLSMAYGVIQNHGGAILIDSSPGEGTTVSIWLPTSEQEEAQEAQEAQEASQPVVGKRKARVLLVDDEEMIRTTGRRMLSAVGCDVILADSGSFAVDAYRNNTQEIDLVVLDLSMPVMDGTECFDRLKEIDPTVRVLICTGHEKRLDTEEMISNGVLGVVRKPFDLDQLSEAIEAALGNESVDS